MQDKRPTVADLLALKGKRQLSMLRVETLEEAEAAQKAGIDMLSVPPELLGPAFREAVPTCFAFPGLEYGDFVSAEEYLRAAFKALKAGGDAVWCAASLQIIRRLRDEGVPVCGHVGLIPPKTTWTGGFKAVGKTLETALLVWRQVKALEEAGAFSAEIEVVPAEVASAISKRTSLFMISMGAGAGCDAQYLFADRCARHQSRPCAASFQGLSQPGRGIRPAAAGADRRVLGTGARHQVGCLSGTTPPGRYSEGRAGPVPARPRSRVTSPPSPIFDPDVRVRASAWPCGLPTLKAMLVGCDGVMARRRRMKLVLLIVAAWISIPVAGELRTLHRAGLFVEQRAAALLGPRAGSQGPSRGGGADLQCPRLRLARHLRDPSVDRRQARRCGRLQAIRGRGLGLWLQAAHRLRHRRRPLVRIDTVVAGRCARARRRTR